MQEGTGNAFFLHSHWAFLLPSHSWCGWPACGLWKPPNQVTDRQGPHSDIMLNGHGLNEHDPGLLPSSDLSPPLCMSVMKESRFETRSSYLWCMNARMQFNQGLQKNMTAHISKEKKQPPPPPIKTPPSLKRTEYPPRAWSVEDNWVLVEAKRWGRVMGLLRPMREFWKEWDFDWWSEIFKLLSPQSPSTCIYYFWRQIMLISFVIHEASSSMLLPSEE